MNKKETEKFIHNLFEKDMLGHSDIKWNEINGDISGRMYVNYITNEQLLPLIALYDIIINPVWDTTWILDKKLIKELGGGRNDVIEIEINDK